MASNDNISNWINRLLSGDEEVFEYIFDLTNRRIYETVFAVVKNGYDTHKFANEVYFQLWKSISKYDQSRPFYFGWMALSIIKLVNGVYINNCREKNFVMGVYKILSL